MPLKIVFLRPQNRSRLNPITKALLPPSNLFFFFTARICRSGRAKFLNRKLFMFWPLMTISAQQQGFGCHINGLVSEHAGDATVMLQP